MGTGLGNPRLLHQASKTLLTAELTSESTIKGPSSGLVAVTDRSRRSNNEYTADNSSCSEKSTRFVFPFLFVSSGRGSVAWNIRYLRQIPSPRYSRASGKSFRLQ